MTEQTLADEALDAARKEIDSAIKHLSGIVVDRIYGSDYFNPLGQDKIEESMFRLLEIRKLLNFS